MACAKEWGVLLSKYVDAEASADERRLVESHLTSCKDCVGTWELFRRNEKILESALAGEAFGDLVVDDVMAELRRLETPPVVAPAADAGDSRWEKVRAWMPTAVAAAMMVATLVVVLVSRPRDMSDEVASMTRRLDDAHQVNTDFLIRMHELDNALIDLRRGARRTYAKRGDGIEVRAEFDSQDDLSSFVLERREANAKSWTVIAKDLSKPYHEDHKAEPGVQYLYRFVGLKSDATRVEAAPIPGSLPVPGGLDPRTSLKVTFIGATNDLSTATFRIERMLDGRPWSQIFQVRRGDNLGGVVNGVDFSTRLYVERITFDDQVIVPGDRPFTRVNQKVTLRAIGSRPTDPTRDLWRLEEPKLFPLP